MTGGATPATVVLGFQVWDAVGWVGQGLFTLRVLVQWLSSERAGRSVVPRSFWWISLAGSLALVVYVVHRKDPVFLAGVSINTAIYLRNLRLVYRGTSPRREGRSPWVPLLLGVGVATAAALLLWQVGAKIVEFDQTLPVLAVGFVGQSIWSSRFVLQWYASERAGTSVLPASFFYVSTLGAVMLFAYAVLHDPIDWVMMAAFVLNPVPYIRNLVLMRRSEPEDAA